MQSIWSRSLPVLRYLKSLFHFFFFFFLLLGSSKLCLYHFNQYVLLGLTGWSNSYFTLSWLLSLVITSTLLFLSFKQLCLVCLKKSQNIMSMTVRQRQLIFYWTGPTNPNSQQIKITILASHITIFLQFSSYNSSSSIFYF